MKRIILGLSVLLMLVQNGFALTDAEFDSRIANAKTLQMKQIHRCDKAAMNNKSTADVNICFKSIKIQRKNGVPESDFGIDYLNVGVIYDYHSDKLNAYKYCMKAAKLGNIRAQKNLNIMCKESPWACK